jgi:hypothetical protein
MNGTSPKFYAKDDGGVEWLVKFGEEAKPETAATRFVWAMGYFTDEDYFLPKINVSRMPKLHCGSRDVAADGTVMNVRLKRQGPGLKKIQNWDWYNNPFLGTREFNGLRVMMALINNWDLTAVNNKVYVADNERHTLVADQGASFGKTGAVTTRSKGGTQGLRRFQVHTRTESRHGLIRDAHPALGRTRSLRTEKLWEAQPHGANRR